jgi:hypothetical protein
MTRKLSLFIFIVSVIQPLQNESLFASDQVSRWPNLKEGRYTEKIETLLNRWKSSKVHIHVSEKQNQLLLQTIPTLKDSTYLGIMAKTTIGSKLANVVKILIDVGGYKSIYPDLDEVSFKKVEAADFEIHWKFSGPMGSHTVYDTLQRVSEFDKSKGDLVYQLKKSDDVLDSDGFILLEEKDGLTKYISVDFFNAKWGIAGSLFKGKIWETTFDSTKKATLAIKSQAEKIQNSNDSHPEKVLVNYVGLDDREKQKTFENLEPEIFDEGKDSQQHSQ